MHINPCGEQGILIDVTAEDAELSGLSQLFTVLRIKDEVASWQLPGIVDLVPAATTLLIMLDTTQILPKEVAARVSTIDLAKPVHSNSAQNRELEIPVRYDGPDLAQVAELLGMSPEALVAKHQDTVWTAAFGGFAPGFAYLVAENPLGNAPRLSSPRPSIPAGSVGLAGEFSGVYPQSSPGGWQLIGSTDTKMWDVSRTDRPAFILPGDNVRFVEVKA
ncbi:allophanate hydrolase subunit 1 [Staphylococcus chromogenes]|nr:allophanate hydrolase subunit 1 [Staphylococcus chromogenes]